MSDPINWLDKALEWGWTAVGAALAWLARKVHRHIKTQELHDARMALLENDAKHRIELLSDLKDDVSNLRVETRQGHESMRADIRSLTEIMIKGK